jgi:hypothetical protein
MDSMEAVDRVRSGWIGIQPGTKPGRGRTKIEIVAGHAVGRGSGSVAIDRMRAATR